MHFQAFARVVVMTTTLASAIFVPGSLPDGLYNGKQFANGTTITTSLSDLTLPPLIEQHEVHPRRSLAERSLEKRQGACWGYQLDGPSVDADNAGLQAYVTSVGDRLCSDSHNEWYGQVSNGVLVYICIDENNYCFVVWPVDIQAGMQDMDNICAPYEAGWATIPNWTPTVLMGKCGVNSDICNSI